MTADEELRRALHELEGMHDYAHETTWNDCYVCGIIRAALAARSEPRAEGLRCSAVWNGCVCGRKPHKYHDDRHVWMNTLDDGAAVDPAQYPAATPPAEGLDVERLRVAAERVLNARGVISHARALDELRAALAAEQPE